MTDRPHPHAPPPNQQALDDLDAAILRVVRLLALEPRQTARLRSGIEQLAAGIAEDGRLSPGKRRQHRRRWIAALRSVQTALRRVYRVLEQLRPHDLAALNQVLAPEIGSSFSNGAFARNGIEVGGDADDRDIELIRRRHRDPGPLIAQQLEGEAEARRIEAAADHGLQVLVSTHERLALRLQRELDRAVLEAPVGRPADRPRQLALAGLWDIYAELTGSELGAAPPPAYLELCTWLLPVLGLPSSGDALTGLKDAAERLFAQAMRRRAKQGQQARAKRGQAKQGRQARA